MKNRWSPKFFIQALFLGLGFTTLCFVQNQLSDPRGENVFKLKKKREFDSIALEQRSRESIWIPAPGLKATQIAWSYLNILEALSNDASYQGESSWLTAKLEQILNSSHPKEVSQVSLLIPYVFMMAEKDTVGCSILMNSLIKRAKNDWRPWFWSAYHAFSNLKNFQLSGSLYLEAAKFKDAPELALRLGLKFTEGKDIFTNKEKFGTAIESLPPVLVEKLRERHPTLF